MNLFLKGEHVVTQRLAWVVGICAEKNPSLVRPYLRRLVEKMQEPDVHDAVKRNVVRMLQCIDIPAPLLGTVATLCFDYLSNPATPIAVKCCSMTVIARLAEKEPELGRELRLLIDQQLPFAGGAFHARARQIWKSLEQSSPEDVHG